MTVLATDRVRSTRDDEDDLDDRSDEFPIEADGPTEADPADSTVAVGAVPELEQPVRPSAIQAPRLPSDVGRGWAVTAILTAVAAVLRFWQLGYRTDGGTPIFDEKYYALNSWEVLNNGGYEANPGYGVVVHPPLGKQLIAIGEWLFGYNGLGWRFTTAVCGVIIVALVIRVVRRMTGSTFIGGLAGILLICDGVSHVQARTGLLDNVQAMFVSPASSAWSPTGTRYGSDCKPRCSTAASPTTGPARHSAPAGGGSAPACCSAAPLR